MNKQSERILFALDKNVGPEETNIRKAILCKLLELNNVSAKEMKSSFNLDADGFKDGLEMYKDFKEKENDNCKEILIYKRNSRQVLIHNKWREDIYERPGTRNIIRVNEKNVTFKLRLCSNYIRIHNKLDQKKMRYVLGLN